jgi:hypothetical protein
MVSDTMDRRDLDYRGRHTRTCVTRRLDEEWDPTYVAERHQGKKGWMLWGCFHGHTKGSGIFWGRDWGSISKDSYQACAAYTATIFMGILRR